MLGGQDEMPQEHMSTETVTQELGAEVNVSESNTCSA